MHITSDAVADLSRRALDLFPVPETEEAISEEINWLYYRSGFSEPWRQRINQLYNEDAGLSLLIGKMMLARFDREVWIPLQSANGRAFFENILNRMNRNPLAREVTLCVIRVAAQIWGENHAAIFNDNRSRHEMRVEALVLGASYIYAKFGLVWEDYLACKKTEINLKARDLFLQAGISLPQGCDLKLELGAILRSSQDLHIRLLGEKLVQWAGDDPFFVLQIPAEQLVDHIKRVGGSGGVDAVASTTAFFF